MVAATRSLQDWFAQEGFAGPIVRGASLVEFSKGSLVVQFEFYEEEPPPRSIMVSIGLAGVRGGMRTTRAVGLWSLIPEDDPAQSYSLWGFNDQAELEAALSAIRDRVLPRFARPWWKAPDRLVAAVERSERALRATYDAGIVQRELEEARRSFKRGDFRDALDRYARVDRTALTSADEQRVKIARRSPGGPPEA